VLGFLSLRGLGNLKICIML